MKINAFPIRMLYDRASRACEAIEDYLDDLDAADRIRPRLGELAATFEDPTELLAELGRVQLPFNGSGAPLGRDGEAGELNASLHFLIVANAESLEFGDFGFHRMPLAHHYALFSANVLSRLDGPRIAETLRSSSQESREFESLDDEGSSTNYAVPSRKYLRIDVARAVRRLPIEFATAMRLLLQLGGEIDAETLIGKATADREFSGRGFDDADILSPQKVKHLLSFCDENLKGGLRDGLETVLRAERQLLPLPDFADAQKWVVPFDNSFSSWQTRVNQRLESADIPFRIERWNNCVRLRRPRHSPRRVK